MGGTRSKDTRKQPRADIDQLASGLGIGTVAYVETPPPVKEQSPSGVRQIDLGGVIITSGGGTVFTF